MQKADHSGHRSRMKKKLLDKGLDVFEPHEVLEILLYYAVPQRNTNDIAKNLIDRYGSISAVFEASLDSLKENGLTEHQAILLKLIPDVTRLYMLDKYESPDKVIDFLNISEYIADRFVGYEQQEHVLLVLADKKGREVYSGMIAQGDFDNASVSLRQIISLAINYSASSAILAHNHPSGIARPSREDIISTRSFKEALSLVGVSLIDHYIVSGHDCVSLAECDLL